MPLPFMVSAILGLEDKARIGRPVGPADGARRRLAPGMTLAGGPLLGCLSFRVNSSGGPFCGTGGSALPGEEPSGKHHGNVVNGQSPLPQPTVAACLFVSTAARDHSAG